MERRNQTLEHYLRIIGFMKILVQVLGESARILLLATGWLLTRKATQCMSRPVTTYKTQLDIDILEDLPAANVKPMIKKKRQKVASSQCSLRFRPS
jgi:hypothetical protein